MPSCRGFAERPWFDALFSSWGAAVAQTPLDRASAADDADSLSPLPLSPAHWQAISSVLELSPRQSEIAELMVRGAQLKEIAAALGIKICTVRNQQERIYLKTGIRTGKEFAPYILGLSHRVGHCRCGQK